MDVNRILQLNETINPLNEFKADLKKQCVMLMGLPAAGKSSFINTGQIKKYIPGFTHYSVLNSDGLMQELQHEKALRHFETLKNEVHSEEDLKEFIRMTEYTSNDGGLMSLPLTWKWWEDNKNSGFKPYYDKFFKVFYASYFDARDMAKDKDNTLFDLKIVNSGNVLIIDTTGTDLVKAERRFQRAHEEGFTTTVLYLAIDPEFCVERDLFRKKKEGRSVGASVIYGYAKKMEQAAAVYASVGRSSNAWVDRLIIFEWVGSSNPKTGHYKLISDQKFYIEREKKGLA